MRSSCFALALPIVAALGCNTLAPVDDSGSLSRGVGDACESPTDCRLGLTCTANVCQPRGNATADQFCTLTADCVAPLYCAASGTCQPAGTSAVGGLCADSGSCVRGAVCLRTGMGLWGTCLM